MTFFTIFTSILKPKLIQKRLIFVIKLATGDWKFSFHWNSFLRMYNNFPFARIWICFQKELRTIPKRIFLIKNSYSKQNIRISSPKIFKKLSNFKSKRRIVILILRDQFFPIIKLSLIRKIILSFFFLYEQYIGLDILIQVQFLSIGPIRNLNTLNPKKPFKRLNNPYPLNLTSIYIFLISYNHFNRKLIKNIQIFRIYTLIYLIFF